MFNVGEHALAEAVDSGQSPTVTELEFHRPVQSRSVAKKTVRTVFSSTTFTVPMAESVRNLVDRAFD